jgi:hypothetical protein
MRLKIRGGTANSGEPSLCLTCRFATVVKDQRLREEIVECSRLSDHSRITFPVNFCTDYADRRHASIHEMEDIAWVLRSDPRCNEIGFVKKPDTTYENGFSAVSACSALIVVVGRSKDLRYIWWDFSAR